MTVCFFKMKEKISYVSEDLRNIKKISCVYGKKTQYIDAEDWSAAQNFVPRKDVWLIR
jgi:hypothetical protein